MTSEKELTDIFNSYKEKARKDLFFRIKRLEKELREYSPIARKNKIREILLQERNLNNGCQIDDPSGQTFHNRFKEDIIVAYRAIDHQYPDNSKAIGLFLKNEMVLLQRKHLGKLRDLDEKGIQHYYHDSKFVREFDLKECISWLARTLILEEMLKQYLSTTSEINSIDLLTVDEGQTQSASDKQFKTRKQVWEQYGISESTFYRWIEKYGISLPRGKLSPEIQEMIRDHFSENQSEK